MKLLHQNEKKFFTTRELIDKLKETNHKVLEVVKDVTDTLAPFDPTENMEEEIVEKLTNASKAIASKMYRLSKNIKARKLRRQDEELDEKAISCSQYSIFQSQSQEDESKSGDEDQDFEFEVIPGETYKKKPLNSHMSQKTRRRRVEKHREILATWASEEGVSVSELLGIYFISLDISCKCPILHRKHDKLLYCGH